MVDLPLSRVYMYPFSLSRSLLFNVQIPYSARFSRGDNHFADWPLTKFHGNDFCGLRILVSHAQSDAAAVAV